MAKKPEIQYIGQFYVYGSEAKQVALEQTKKEKKSLPLAQLEKVEQIAVDPVALCGITVAVFMIVVMVLGAVSIGDAWDEYEVASHYLTELKAEHAALSTTYSKGYDIQIVESAALAMGMVPRDQIEVQVMPVTVPAIEEEPGFFQRQWEDLQWFLDGLFA